MRLFRWSEPWQRRALHSDEIVGSWSSSRQRNCPLILSMESKFKSIFKVQFKTKFNDINVDNGWPCPLVHSMIHFDYICPSQPTRPRHGEVNREPRERSVRSSLNLWSGRKRWDYMNSWRRYWKNFPCRNNYWLVWNKSNETNSFI